MTKDAKNILKHPTLLIPRCIYRCEYVRIGLRVDHVAHIFLNRWRFIHLDPYGWIVR